MSDQPQQIGRARFQDGPGNMRSALASPPPLDSMSETLLVTLPRGAYRLTEDAEGLRVWRVNAEATGDRAGPLTPAQINERNRKHYGLT